MLAGLTSTFNLCFKAEIRKEENRYHKLSYEIGHFDSCRNTIGIYTHSVTNGRTSTQVQILEQTDILWKKNNNKPGYMYT